MRIAPRMENNKISDKLSFLGHLEELRFKIIYSIICFLVIAFLSYFYSEQILYWLIKPVKLVVFNSPADALLVRINVSMWMGLILSLPFVFYQLWSFVAIALNKKEKRAVLIIILSSLVVFVLGLFFGYLVMFPIVLDFFLSFATTWLMPLITAKSYVSFVASLVLGFGLVFQLPIIIFLLCSCGIVTADFLAQRRKYAIVIILIISAIVTPPDGLTMIIMSLPLPGQSIR